MEKKICLNCNGDWNACLGYKCVTWDGVCDCDFEEKNMERNGFGYKIKKE